MKTLYFDCHMGAAGDMITAALLEAMEQEEILVSQLNQLGLPGVVFELERGEVMGSQMHVHIKGSEEQVCDHHHNVKDQAGHPVEKTIQSQTHEKKHQHKHRNLEEIITIAKTLNVSDGVKENICSVFHMIAQAEGEVHRKEMNQIHFHEVGTMDALADVTAVCYLLDRIAPERIMASPIHVGSGQVCCAHGILPVPAPATAKILRGVPIYGGKMEGELCTPTGAALLKYFVKEYGDMPMIRLQSVGYGLGSKKYETANYLSAYLGETE